MKVYPEKTCVICSKEFVGTGPRSKYCCKKCATKANNEQRKPKVLKPNKEKKAGFHIAAQNLDSRNCPICHSTYKPNSASQCYCTPECAAEAKRRKAKAYRNTYNEKIVEHKKKMDSTFHFILLNMMDTSYAKGLYVENFD